MSKDEVIDKCVVFTYKGSAFGIGELHKYIQDDELTLYYALIEYVGQKEPSKFACNDKGILYEGRSCPKEFEEIHPQICLFDIDDQFNALHQDPEYWERVKRGE